MLDYVNFSGLFVLAIGCNVAYFIYSKKYTKGMGDTKDAAFFKFLDSISSTEERIKNLNDNKGLLFIASDTVEEMKKHSIEEMKSYFGEEYINVLNVFNLQKLKTLISKIENMRDYFQQKIIPFERRNNLQNIAFISFLYAFCVTLLAPYNKFLWFNKALFTINTILSACFIMLTVSDVIGKKPIWKTFSVFSVAVIGLLYAPYSAGVVSEIADMKLGYRLADYNHIFTVLVCFAGFIVYTISTVIGYIKSFFYLKRKENVNTFADIGQVEKYRNKMDDFVRKIVKDNTDVALK